MKKRLVFVLLILITLISFVGCDIFIKERQATNEDMEIYGVALARMDQKPIEGTVSSDRSEGTLKVTYKNAKYNYKSNSTLILNGTATYKSDEKGISIENEFNLRIEIDEEKHTLSGFSKGNSDGEIIDYDIIIDGERLIGIENL